MTDSEETLAGGNTSAFVVRVGETVRKPATPATPYLDSVLQHLHAKGFRGAPRSLGCDEQGRHVLEYIAGTPCAAGPPLTMDGLRRVGKLIRALHDALATFEPPPQACWNAAMDSGGNDLICHNDLAPWNLIQSDNRWVFIDWDGAGPGTRLWDLAYAAVTFPPVEPGCNVTDAANRIRAILDGYELEPSRREELMLLAVRRARAMYDLLAKGYETGAQPWARLYSEGHADDWGPVADFLQKHLSCWTNLCVNTLP